MSDDQIVGVQNEAPRLDPGSGDQYLAILVDAINSHTDGPVDTGQQISLFLSGMIITGELIPAWQWFHEQVVAGQEDGVMAKWAEDLKAVADVGDEPPRHIHLRNATFIMWPVTTVIHGPVHQRPDNTVTDGAMHWRGRLSHIAGWTLGELRVVK